MLRMYGAQDRMTELDEIRIDTTGRGWWSVYRLPPWLQSYIGLEDDAVMMRRFTLELIPGMLQTKEYALNLAQRYHVAGPEVHRHVDARMRRKDRAFSGDLELSVVLSEAVLYRTLSMDEVGLGQLRYLQEVMASTEIDIRILPFAAGAHLSMGSIFTILGFPVGTLSAVAYMEQAIGGVLLDDPKVVGELETRYEELRGQALSPASSSGKISEFIKREREVKDE